MTNTNELTAKLKAAALAATPGEWCPDDHHGVIADAGLNANFYIASCSGPEHKANKRFIAAANPAAVLELIAALEAAEKHNAELEQALSAAQNDEIDARCHVDELERRVAELEARKVKLPKRSVGEVMYMSGFSRDYAEGWCSGNDNARREIQLAGINLETGGEA